RRAVRRACRAIRAQGRKPVGAQARQRIGPIFDRRHRRGVPNAQGRARHRARAESGRAPRISCDRDQRAEFRPGLGGSQALQRQPAPDDGGRRVRPIRRAARGQSRRDHQRGRAAPVRWRGTRVLSRRMQIEPAEQAFAERYAAGEPQVVWTTLVADLETPVSAFLKIAGGKPMSFLLESVEGGVSRGRYSVIGLDPDLIWRTNGAGAEINRAARTHPNGFAPCSDAPLASLRALLLENRIELPDRLPPMAAGLFGYLGYDMVRLMEELPPPKPDPIGIPDAVLVRTS